MYNPGEEDNELDHVSREAAAGYKVPGHPDWDAMRERLDTIMPEEKKKRRYFIFWWLVPAILLGGLAYRELSTTTPSAITGTGKGQPMQTPAKNSLPVVANNVPATEENHIDIPKAPQPDRVMAVSESSFNLERAAAKMAALHNRSVVAQGAFAVNTPAVINIDTNKTSAANDPVAKEEVVKNAVDPKENVLPVVIPDKERDSIIETSVTAAPVTTTVKRSKSGKAWSIGIVGSIDESTVKFRYGYEPGYGVGVLAGFHFNKIFSLHSGAIYTQKNYKMAGTDFNAPKGSWPSYYKLETVEGYCRMWEVPLLARFYTTHSDKKGVFLSTGISSYFMTHENYTYAYYYMGQPANRTMDYGASTTHLFSIAHLSAGFESTVGKNMYLQIEPYAKIPLGNLGTGGIRLSSFGVNLSLQYRQLLKKP